MEDKKGKIYLVPTPIAPNTDFITTSDKKTVKSLNNFYVENEKTARRVLSSLDIDVQELNFKIYDKNTNKKEAVRMINSILEGNDIGVMSEAGIPSVADPAFSLVDLAHKNNIEIIPMIGPSSILMALSASGLNGQRFSFNGYIARNQEQRKREIKYYEKSSQKYKQTQIFIEAPYRNIHFWRDLLEVLDENTYLSIAIDLMGDNQFIKTKRVKDWKTRKWPEFNKKPTIFLFRK